MKYKGIIFDFDYTLGDSTNGIVMCVNYALNFLGYDQSPREKIRNTIGLSLDVTYRTLTNDSTKENAKIFAAKFVEKAEIVMTKNTQLLPYAAETVTRLKDNQMQVGIVTTKHHNRIEEILNKFALRDKFDFIIGGDDVAIEKPAPEGLIKMTKFMKCLNKEVLYVGDSIVDAKTAQNADTDFIAVTTGTTKEEEFNIYHPIAILKNINGICEYTV